MKKNESKGYYDFADLTEEALVEGGAVEQLFYIKDLQQRKLFLNSDVEQYTIHNIVKNILQYNKEDAGIPIAERKPIILYIASHGGEVDSGFELVDVICSSKTPVYTVNLGYQYSMGFYIGLSGHKRYAFPNAKYLLHDGVTYLYDSSTKLQDRMAFETKSEARAREFILSHSTVTAEELAGNARTEWYLFAEEAKAKGFVDYIIGVDCDISEIV